MSGEQFAIEEDGDGRHRRLILRGRLDLLSVPRAQGAIARLCEGARATVVLDIRALSSVDSVGMHVLIAAFEAASERGHDLRVLPGARIRDVRDLTDVLAGLPLPDVNDADTGRPLSDGVLDSA
jgi:anti-anti-sigma factor